MPARFRVCALLWRTGRRPGVGTRHLYSLGELRVITTVIPEPSTLLLVALAAGGLSLRRRNRGGE